MSDNKTIEDKIANTILDNIKKHKKKIDSGIDTIVVAMEEVEKSKAKGRKKQAIAKNVIQLLLQSGQGIIPEKALKDMRQFLETDVIDDIFATIIKATKGAYKLNIHKKVLGCLGY